LKHFFLQFFYLIHLIWFINCSWLFHKACCYCVPFYFLLLLKVVLLALIQTVNVFTKTFLYLFPLLISMEHVPASLIYFLFCYIYSPTCLRGNNYYYIMSELKDQLKYGLDSKNLMNTLTLLSILNRNTILWTTVTAFFLIWNICT